MPFTLAHPALILPFTALQRRYYSLTGLVVGSIVPDFEYFLRMEKGSPHYSHNLPGLFYFDLPFGLLLAFVFHLVIKKPLVQNLPAWLSKKVADHNATDWLPYFRQRWHIIALSVVVGTLTHFCWDWLTHISADYVYYHQTELFGFASWQKHNRIYTLVHMTHSLVGLAALAAVVLRLPGNKATAQKTPCYIYWLLIGIVTGAIFWFRLSFDTRLQFRDLVVTIMAAFFLALLFTSLIFSKKKFV